MRAQVLSIGSMARNPKRLTEEEIRLEGFTKALVALSYLRSPVVSENKAAVEQWVAEGKLSHAERNAVHVAMGWEIDR